jgi:hypothetical protein
LSFCVLRQGRVHFSGASKIQLPNQIKSTWTRQTGIYGLKPLPCPGSQKLFKTLQQTFKAESQSFKSLQQIKKQVQQTKTMLQQREIALQQNKDR